MSSPLVSQGLDVVDLPLLGPFPLEQEVSAYLFNSLWGQQDGMLIPDTHAIFNSNPNPAEHLRPAVVVGYVYTSGQTWLGAILHGGE